MVEDIKRCSYCGKLGSDKDIKETAYGLFGMYSDICEDCYVEVEIEACENRNIKVI